MIVPDEGRVPWRRLLWSLLAALAVAVVGFIALLADVQDPRPLQIAIETIALPFVRLYLVGGLRSDPALWLAVLSSMLVWWAALFAFLTFRARKRNAHRRA